MDHDTPEPSATHHQAVQAEAKVAASLSVEVRRGEKAWSFFYTLLGFALTIETGIVGLIDPLKWPWNLITLIIVGALTTYLIVDNGWFQNKLLGIKARYENKLR